MIEWTNPKLWLLIAALIIVIIFLGITFKLILGRKT